jgi:hypothetical protein
VGVGGIVGSGGYFWVFQGNFALGSYFGVFCV